MPSSIFVNVAVGDLPRSRAFYSDLGYSFNERFSDDTAACLVISDTIYAMLITPARFSDFTTKKIADATTVTEAILALSVDSREEVDALADKALAAGGSPALEPSDLGFMYSRSFQDPDGHQWEVFWMDPQAAQDGPPAD